VASGSRFGRRFSEIQSISAVLFLASSRVDWTMVLLNSTEVYSASVGRIKYAE
jgi:hypothetical protein